MTNRRAFLLLLPLLWLLTGAARIVPLEDPAPVPVPAGLAAEKVVVAIKSALLAKKWTIGAEAPGRIDATLYIRSHTVRVALVHDDKQVRLSYVSSDNLKFKDDHGRREIHRNYGVWTRDLTAEIGRLMQAESLK